VLCFPVTINHNRSAGSSYQGGPFNEVFKNATGNAGNAVGIRVGNSISDTQHIPVESTVNYSDSTSDQGGGTTVPQGVVKFVDTNRYYAANDYLIVRIDIPEGSEAHIDAMAITFGSTTQSNRILGNTQTTL